MTALTVCVMTTNTARPFAAPRVKVQSETLVKIRESRLVAAMCALGSLVGILSSFLLITHPVAAITLFTAFLVSTYIIGFLVVRNPRIIIEEIN